MKILYLSSVTSDKYFSELFTQGKTFDYVGQKYHSMFIKGLENHFDDQDITVLCQPPTTRLSLKISEKQNRVNFRYVPILPIPVIKQLLAFLYSFFYALWWCIKNIREQKVVICSIMRIYQFVPILFLSYIFRCKKVTIACDIPWLTMTQVKQTKPSYKQRIVMWLSRNLASAFDAYVFLTESMNEILNPNKRPYIVIEGFCDVNMQNRTNTVDEKYNKNVIIYAGGLNIKYGIGNLVEAVNNISDYEVELWLYGKGDITKHLVSNEKIKLIGPRSNEEVVDSEIKARLLVNPRPSDGEYTRYSFPSKTLEYMVSGTYTLTTKLAGIPSEYFDYCGVIEDESSEGIKRAIEKALSMGYEQLHQKGIDAKEFVINNKNNVKQTFLVKELLESLMV